MSDLIIPGTAIPLNVLAGKTCTSSKGYMFTGIMTNNGGVAITPSNVSQGIPQGYHDGTGQVAAVTVPVANVLTGTTIAGQAGTMVNKSGIWENATGMSQNGAGVLTLFPTTAYYTPSSGLNKYDPNFIAANIPLNMSMFSLVGTGANAKRSAEGSGTTDGSASLTVTGLSFTPTKIIAEAHITSTTQYIRTTYWNNTYDTRINNEGLVLTIGSGAFSTQSLGFTITSGGFSVLLAYTSMPATWTAYE